MYPLLQWKSNYKLRDCVNKLTYLSYGAHAPYCHLWPFRLCSIFPHYLTRGTIFEKNLLNIKCVFRVCLQILSHKFLILRNTECDRTKYVYCPSCTVPVKMADFN
jgi:hypothetical protein